MLKNCFDSISKEKKLINLFKQKYIQRRDYGAEYFQGDVVQMMDDLYHLAK